MGSVQQLVIDRVERSNAHVEVIRLNRPESRNPLDHATVKALLGAVRVAEEEESIRGVIITGQGDAFSAGGDLRGYLDLYEDKDRFRGFLEDFAALCSLLETSSLVTCAMVNGACVAGGLELALACDFITLSDGARIGDGHLRSGQLPGGGGSQRLCRAIGIQKAKEMLLTGRLYSAGEALGLGLANFVWSQETLETETLQLVSECCQHSELGLGLMKDLIQTAQTTPLPEGIEYEIETVWRYATTSHDAREGLHAFLERREARFKGR